MGCFSDNAKPGIMVKFYESSFSYDYSFSAVALAYFLRYPNPYSTHVLSTDVIERTFDPTTQRLHTVRLHLKRSKLPPGIVKLLPKSLLGGSSSGDSQSYILEQSTVDVREGWMETESRNLEWTGVLSVIEKQHYKRATDLFQPVISQEFGKVNLGKNNADSAKAGRTDVITTVQLLSRLGQSRWKRIRGSRDENRATESDDDGGQAKVGLLRSWSTASIQRSIELIGYKRTQGSQPKATEGMKLVLERLRQGGLVAVIEGMRNDREAAAMGVQRRWKTLNEARTYEGRREFENIADYNDD